MATSEVDMKFLGQFADNIQLDHPFLAQNLFQILGNLVMLSEKVIRARKLRRLDTTRDTKSVDLYCRIIWYAREGLKLLEEYVLPMVANYGELKVLAYKLRASFYHLYVLFHNQPSISLKSAQLSTPPGLKSPRNNETSSDLKGKTPERSSPTLDPTYRPSSVQPTHSLEGGPVGGITPPKPPPHITPSFLVPAADYRPLALRCFQDASSLAERILWGSHPLRLSVRVEFAAFLYDCLHEKERSRSLAKHTIQEVYNAQEGMDDDMFEDAAELVGILGRMMKRGLGSGGSGSTPGGGSAGAGGSGSLKTSPPNPGTMLRGGGGSGILKSSPPNQGTTLRGGGGSTGSRSGGSSAKPSPPTTKITPSRKAQSGNKNGNGNGNGNGRDKSSKTTPQRKPTGKLIKSQRREGMENVI